MVLSIPSVRAWRSAVAFLAVSLFATTPAWADDATVYDVGVGKIDITPAYPIRLNGFGSRREESEGITQRIWAKALAIGSDEAKPVVLITLDSLGVREAMVEEVARRLKEKAGIERDRIAVTFSHSHTTPKLTNVCDTIFSSPIPTEHQARIDQYTAELTDAMEQAALAALADRKPSTLAWAVGKVGFATNRRTPGGPVDHDLPMLVVKSADDGSVRAVYLTYACHCVSLTDNKISGDWSGFAQEMIERSHPGVTALVSIGCGSDSNPNFGAAGRSLEAAVDQGRQISDEVDRLLAGPFQPISGPVTAALSHIELPLNQLPTREALEKLAANDDPAGYNAKFQLAKLDRGEPLQTKLDYPIQTWAFGDSVAMVFLGGEVCVDYALRLKSELAPDRIWMHGYSNDFCSYIPSERLLKEGGYGGGAEVVYFALPNTLAAGLEDKIVAQVHEQLPAAFKTSEAGSQAGDQPWPLERALASIVPKQGFVVEVAAAEPLVADPVAIDFGPDGRMWVAEMPDYYRYTNDEFAPHGSIQVLADSDGDGRYDEASTFCDGLRFPTDVLVWNKGAIVCDAPDVIYFEDADGDGNAETRKVLLTGFETHNAQARVNSLRWGLDNWLYGSCGIFGGKIRTFAGKEIDLGGRDFRFRPDTGEFEPATGSTQQGRARDDWGNWFGCENSSLMDHYPMEDRYLSRNPHIAPPAVEVSIPAGSDPNRLFPIGELTLFKMSGPPGRPTAACGLDIYRDELLGPDFSNNVFVAEPVNRLIHRRQLKPDGATFNGMRADDESDVDFLASTDPWFRPVQVRTGTDGCLYVVDMHREVIEHKKFIPEEELHGLQLTAGRDQGRIYRIRLANAPPRPKMRLDKLDATALAAAIDSPNGPQRDWIQQTLVQRGAKEAVPQLVQVSSESSRSAARLQALCTLDGLHALDGKLVLAALNDADPAVRRHAIRLSEPFLASDSRVLDGVLKLVDDADSQVQLQLAYTLGTTSDPRVPEALARIAARNASDPLVMGGAWSSVGKENAVAVAQAMLKQAAVGKLKPSRLAPAIRLVAELGTKQDFLAIAETLHGDAAPDAPEWQLATAALVEQSQRKSLGVEKIQQLAAPMVAAARDRLAAGEGDEPQQLAALKLLVASGSQGNDLLPLLQRLLEPQNSPAVHRAAIELAAAIGSDEAADALLEPWRSYTSAARGQAFNLLLGNERLTSLLLERIAAGKIGSGDLDALQRQRLLAHADEEIRSKAAEVLAGTTDANRDKVVKQYVAEVAALASASDPGRGREAFAKHCSGCHRVQDQGFEVGPDLAALTSRSASGLIESIFDPNRALDERYRSYSAQTVDGLSHTGILAAETSTSVTLKEQEGKQHTLLRSDLDLFETSGKSLMPEGLERDLTPQAVADVIAYLRTIGPPAKTIAGNRPQLVSAGEDGSLRLLAENGAIFGDDITYEPLHRNIGYWHGQLDHVAWDVDVPAGGEYEVALDAACIDDAAGNGFVVEGGATPLHGTVKGTGNFDSGVGDYHSYQSQNIGRIKLAEGPNRIIIRPDGPLKSQYLMDLRGLQLSPVSKETAPDKKKDATAEIKVLLDGLAVGKPEEYERIPKIWESAIAAARRNEDDELIHLLEFSLPEKDKPLHDWQAVVIGGGVINGVGLIGEWPGKRMDELLKDRPDLRAKWERTILLADKMADNERVKTGTRYDALRIIALGDWDKYGKKLIGYLQKGVDPELNMGAVSGLSDMENAAVPPALIASLGYLDETNRKLAIEALARTPERARRLLDAIKRGEVREDSLTAEQRAAVEKAAGGKKD